MDDVILHSAVARVLLNKFGTQCGLTEVASWLPIAKAALAAADRVQTPAAHEAAEKPDFPPWSREVWDLIIALVSTTIGPNLERNEVILAKMRAAFREAPDAG